MERVLCKRRLLMWVFFQLQGAALAVAQYLTATSLLEVDDSESSESESENELLPPVRPPAEVPPSNVNRNKPKKPRNQEPRNQEPPPEVNPVVTQLMEMGFPKRNVKLALKAIGEYQWFTEFKTNLRSLSFMRIENDITCCKIPLPLQISLICDF